VTPAIVWFRQDLRLQDNPALRAAIGRGGPVVPVFILDDAGEGLWPAGGAARWWLHHSLAALDASLREVGSRLVLARGDSREELGDLVAATGAGAVFWNRRLEPAAIARDARIRAALEGAGAEVATFNGSLLFEPAEVANKQGRPFQVFTAFWRHCIALPVEPPGKFLDDAISAPSSWPPSLDPAALNLTPRSGWDEGLREAWQPGETGAAARLKAFIASELDGYAENRDRPETDGTSMLSPSLHWGELSPRQVWAAVRSLSKDTGVFPPGEGARAFLDELGWREFAHHLLFHFPHTPQVPLREEFAEFPWAEDPGSAKLRSWRRGRTGYPIVDAGMRQLWRLGWMHNRVRMIAASFLVKHLRLPWTHGAAWFWDTLVDADLANNTLNWQWVAGCGADAAPYFRIFAPVVQGEKFDPHGAYVRRWVPELSRVPARFVHRPWEASSAVLAASGVRLGETYPFPMVGHAEARAAALDAFKRFRARQSGLSAGGRTAQRHRALQRRLNGGKLPGVGDVGPIA